MEPGQDTECLEWAASVVSHRDINDKNLKSHCCQTGETAISGELMQLKNMAQYPEIPIGFGTLDAYSPALLVILIGGSLDRR
tara:strand:+ start:193 stop:438 length:246 start_codon:yes stop_codon:yes gene_type:complete